MSVAIAGRAGRMGVELPVRYLGLTLGRYVLVPASPTTGVEFSPGRRAEAMSMAAPVGCSIAAAMIGESEGLAMSPGPEGSGLRSGHLRVD